MKAGVSTACLYPLYVEKSLERLSQLKIDNTEIFINSDSELEEEFVNRLSCILRSGNIKCASLHPFTCELDNLMFFSQYERRLCDILEYHKKYFNAMNILGAEIFVFHGNKTATPVSPEFYNERFSRLCELGKSFGVIVSHENVARCQCHSLEFMKSLLKINSDIRFTLDVKQCVRAGQNPFEIVSEIGENIVHVHISDNNSNSNCIQIGKGTFDIMKLLSVLKSKGFTGSVIIELYRNGFENDSELYQNFISLSEIIERI